MPPRRRDEASPEALPETLGPDAPEPETGTAEEAPRPHTVVPRREQFLIGAGPLAFLESPDIDAVASRLREHDRVEIVDILSPRIAEKRAAENGHGAAGLAAAAAEMPRHVIVARMPAEHADALRLQFGGRLTIEPDALLTVCSSDPAYALDAEFHDPGVAVPHGPGVTMALLVTGDGKPLPDCSVYLFGAIWSAQGQTDASGRVVLTVYGESADTLGALLVRPKADHWSVWVRNPTLRPGQDNLVDLKPLARSHEGFPERPLIGWGQRAMGFDRLPAAWKGQGVKVALVDSGVATSHRNLSGIGSGRDVVGRTADGWNRDETGHGSQCAGILAGRDTGTGIRGIAPEAELHVHRVFPGGRLSDLIRSLDDALDAGVEIILLGLGCPQASQIVEQRLALARQAGVACIAAAGNTAGPVEYPAASPQVLAVGAIGKRGEFPDDSYHATMAPDGLDGVAGGVFPARFSSHGPAVDLVGPGVAVVSSVPPDGFAACDGTSVAAAHVAGLAVLVLAHHPEFANPVLTRDSRRVDRLFQILKDSARPVVAADPGRCGVGLPDAVRAFGLEAGRVGTDLLSDASVWPARPAIDLNGLREAMREIGLIDGRGGNANGKRPAEGPPAVSLDQLRAGMKDARLL